MLRNPSGQNQFLDHFFPNATAVLFLLTIPKIGIWLGFLPIAFSLYKEFIKDEHWKDFFSTSDSGADGRIDLLFRLLGCGLGFTTLLW